MAVPSEFLREKPIRGIIIIRNLKTDRIYLKKTEDAVRSYKDERFRLDLSMHESKELQKEYTALGLELFTIELECEAKDGEDLDELLSRTRSIYAERGYCFY